MQGVFRAPAPHLSHWSFSCAGAGPLSPFHTCSPDKLKRAERGLFTHAADRGGSFASDWMEQRPGLHLKSDRSVWDPGSQHLLRR